MPPRRRSRRHRLDATTNRRQFLQALGATSALPFLVALPSWAQPPASPPATSATPPATPGGTPSSTPPAATPEPPDPETLANQADARSLFDILQRRYGTKWTPAQADAMRGDLESGVANGRALRKLALQNGDEPAVVFRPLPLPGGPRS